MTHSEIRDKVIALIANQLGIDVSTITADSTLESLGADSVDRFEFVIKLEEDFNITVDDQEADKLTSVAQVVSYIEKEIAKK